MPVVVQLLAPERQHPSMIIASLPGFAPVHCLMQPPLCLSQFLLNPLSVRPGKKQITRETLTADTAQYVASAIDD